MKKIISGILAGIICIANFNSLNSKAITIEEYIFDSNFHNWNIYNYTYEDSLSQITIKIIGNLLEVDGPHIRYDDASYNPIDFRYSGSYETSDQVIVQIGEHFFKVNNGEWELTEVKYNEISVLSNGGHIFSFDFDLDTLYYFPGYGNEGIDCYVGYYSSNDIQITSKEYVGSYLNAIDFYKTNKSFILFEDTEVQYYNETLSINNVEIDYKNCSCVEDSRSNVNADINNDNKIDARDASLILTYAADCGAGNFSGTLEDWLLTQD